MNNILIIHHYSEQELRDHSFGGTRLIWKQKKFFESLSNFKVKVLSLQEMSSFSSRILGYSSTFRNNKTMSYVRQDSEKRWLLNLIFGILIHYIAKIDSLWKRQVLNLVKTYKPNSILCNDPIYAGIISEISNSQNVFCVLYEHNIWWRFYDQLLNNKSKYKPFIWLMEYIELNAIKKSNSVICMSNEDKKVLIHQRVPSKKISVWVPFGTVSAEMKLKIPTQLGRKLKDKFVVGFLGANFEPNVMSVENIIQIARNLENKAIVFLILGKVCDAFKNRKDLPDNIILKGFVSNVDSYLSLCDAFFNPKTVCDTGIEIKMFDYLKFNKPIITTEIGARGFENFKGIIISSIDEFSSKINALLRSK
jgi:glycosyltransferase involved in cell wall biosynthesis